MFEYGKAKISAIAPTIEDSDNLSDLLMKFPESQRTTRTYRFLEFALFAKVEGDISLPSIDMHSSAEDVEAAYAVWRKFPRSFLTKWHLELQAVEGDPKG